MSITGKIDEYGPVAVTWFVAELGAAELALRGLTDVSIINQLPADLQSLAFAGIGLAALVAFADDFELI